ncbi:MAG: lipid asymmetry maintenance protein MlaB [bacterium]
MYAFEKKKDNNIIISGEITVTDVDKLHSHLENLIDKNSGGSLVLDLNELRKLDTSTVQVFVSFKQSMEKRNTEIIIKNPSARVREVFEVYGLLHYFGC